jgi:predicted alpha/beta superfamily hydrolase
MFNHYFKVKYYVEKLNREVELFIATNADFSDECPLILMHDGQNLFEDQTAAYGRSWRLLDHIQQGDFPKVHMVGISNNQEGYQRLDEYSPFKCEDDFAYHAGFGFDLGGKGDLYLDWIFNDLLNDLRKLISFNAVYMGGSSMGGYISMAAALSYPNQLTGVFCLSNAWWFNYHSMVARIRQFDGQLPKIYLDTGTKESSNAKVRKAYRDMHDSITNELRQKSPKKLISSMIKKAEHHEAEWDKRFDEVLIELLKD